MRLLVVGVAAACVSAAAVAVLASGSLSSSASWSERVEACRPSGGESVSAIERRRSYECVQQVVLDAAHAQDVAPAARAITDTAARDNNFYALCHEAMHTLGPTLIEFYGSAEAAILQVNTIDCGNGLAHGVLDAWAALDSTDASMFPAMVEACERANEISNGGCAEGVGHAAFEHQDPGPARQSDAFKLCELFSSNDAAFSCAYGAIMQPYFKQNPEVIDAAPLEFPSDAGLVGLCSAQVLNVPVRQGCYAGAGWMMALELTLKEDEFPPVGSAPFTREVSRRLSFCDLAPSAEAKMLCEDFFFARLPVSWYQPLSELEPRCAGLAKVAGERFFSRCLAGAYEFTPPQEMLGLVREYPEVAELVRPRWERERGPLPLS